MHILPSDKGELRKLQDEINTLTKKNCELENLLIRKENNSIGPKDCLDGNLDTNKLKELEKNYRQLKQEKDECHKVRVSRFERSWSSYEYIIFKCRVISVTLNLMFYRNWWNHMKS